MEVRVKWIGNMSFAAETGSGHSIVMDGAPEAGGRNLAARPMEMVLVGLGGCSSFDIVKLLKEAELERALKLDGLELIGINNRDLHTFETNLENSINLAKQIPADKIVVSESGINTREDIKLLAQHGIYASLIGEALMTAENRGEKLRALVDSNIKAELEKN